MAARTPMIAAGIPHAKAVLSALLLCLLLFGGASRADALSQALERATAVALLAAIFWDTRERLPLDCRTLVYLLAAWTVLIAVQLLPLPPALWSALPGRDMLVHFFQVMDRPLPWRPLSLQPDVTANSLLSMLVPWAVLLSMGLRLQRDELLVELVLMAFLLLSLAMGALQMVSGGHSFYFYTITNLGSPVGLFANRNHNAFIEAMLVPLVTRMLLRRSAKRSFSLGSYILLGGVIFAVLINILVIGSRMGLVLLFVSLVATWVQLRLGIRRQTESRRAKPERLSAKRRKYLILGGIALALGGLVVMLVVFSDRFIAFSRFSGTGTEEDRLQYLPWTIKLIWEYFPVGSGFGTFPTVFKIIEPDALLRLSYLNHAHDDVLEILVEGGVVAACLALVFIVVWIVRSIGVWAADRHCVGGDSMDQARLGSILSGLLLVGSATDYPLRTPACAAIFAIACYWLFREKPRTVTSK